MAIVMSIIVAAQNAYVWRYLCKLSPVTDNCYLVSGVLGDLSRNDLTRQLESFRIIS